MYNNCEGRHLVVVTFKSYDRDVVLLFTLNDLIYDLKIETRGVHVCSQVPLAFMEGTTL